MRRLLGTSKLSITNKMTLIENVVKHLDARIGDLIVFYDDEGKIIIERLRIEDVKNGEMVEGLVK